MWSVRVNIQDIITEDERKMIAHTNKKDWFLLNASEKISQPYIL